jgi:hypothetical protein
MRPRSSMTGRLLDEVFYAVWRTFAPPRSPYDLPVPTRPGNYLGWATAGSCCAVRRSVMSYVIAEEQVISSAATDLANTGSTLSAATAAAAPPTTSVLAAAEDEVSAATASPAKYSAVPSWSDPYLYSAAPASARPASWECHPATDHAQLRIRSMRASAMRQVVGRVFARLRQTMPATASPTRI